VPDLLLRQIPGYDPIETAGECWFDHTAALKPINFSRDCLTHVEGELAGQPMEFEVWQQAVIANLFGWKRPDGTRRYREAFVYVPRKNGKTTLLGAIVTYVGFCDKEAGAQIVTAAAERDQASILWGISRRMVEQEEVLTDACKVHKSLRTIEIPATGTTIRPLSAEHKSKHGMNLHLGVVDELHVQGSPDLVDVLRTSVGARRQPMIVYITTADYARESICNTMLDYARKVRDGVIEDEQFLPVIYEATTADDWTDEDTWRRANPNYGVSIRADYLKAECEKARQMPSYENTFKRLHLNIVTEQAVRWLPIEAWDECVGDETPEEMAERLKGKKCFGGLDLATKRDLSAFCLYFPEGAELLCWTWAPEEGAHEKERLDRAPYLTWSRQGYIDLTPGNVTDHRAIGDKILALAELYDVQDIAFDRWNAVPVIRELQEQGLKLAAYGQGYRDMSVPTKELESLVISRRLCHGGNPLLRWCASNVVVEHDAADNIKPVKDKSSERIDPIVAAVMAIGRSLAEEQKGPSVYESRGVLVF
jgi:phage terminase large subunit-like protein